MQRHRQIKETGQMPSVSAVVTLVTDVRSSCGGGKMTPVALKNDLEAAVRFLIKP